MATVNTDGLRFKDKVAIVTGGCSGIGRGCVDVFVENGGKVAVLDIDETTGNSLSTDGPGEMYFIHCDVSNEEQLKKAIVSTYEKYGRIDCLVNNAGYHPGHRNIDVITTSSYRTLIDLLLVAPFVASRESLPYLRKTKGTIVNISSMSGVSGQPGCPDYSSVKSLACDEAKHGVRVNAIAPGPIRTPLLESFCKIDPAVTQNMIDYTHLKRIGEAREVALTCLFLATDATYTTGVEITCSGGMEVGYGLKKD